MAVGVVVSCSQVSKFVEFFDILSDFCGLI